MKAIPIVASLGLLATLAAAPALAGDSLVKFDGGIGSQPLRAGAATNAVGGVNPGGAPWVIESLKADIKTDGRIKAKGEGLLLGGGDTIGSRGGPRQVVASLFCRAAPVPPSTTGALITVSFNSEFVDLDANGDFEIRGTLTNAVGATPPADCGDNVDNRPVLLIRTVTAGAPGAWFAAGILKD